MSGRSEYESFIRARFELNVDSGILWSITLIDAQNYVLYGLMNFGNPVSGQRRHCTLATWFQVARGQVRRNDVFIDSAPFAFVLGTLPDLPPAEDPTVAVNLKNALNLSGELNSTGREDFAWLEDELKKEGSPLLLPVTDQLAEDCLWFGPSCRLATDSVRLSGAEAIRAYYLDFAEQYVAESRHVELKAQAEDTLLLGMEVTLRKRSTGEEQTIPLFAALTTLGRRIVRIVQAHDSLKLHNWNYLN
ncbi:hypothetical protein IT575_05855 [bacterium]|nr:hypothetical protein [bacterium]